MPKSDKKLKPLQEGSWYRHVDKERTFPFGYKIGKYTGRSGSGWPCFEHVGRAKSAINGIDEMFELAV
jgi:hypothetical protein